MTHIPSSTDTGIRQFTVDAILFDLDGTLIDSTPATEQAWRTWANKWDW